MTPADRDDDFDATLRERRAFVPRFEDDADAQPPPQLDLAVKQHARAALEARPRRRDSFPLMRWTMPVAIAATLVLSFALVLQLGRLSDPAVPDSTLSMPTVRLRPADTAPAASAVAAESTPAAALADSAAERADAPPAYARRERSEAPAPVAGAANAASDAASFTGAGSVANAAPAAASIAPVAAEADVAVPAPPSPGASRFESRRATAGLAAKAAAPATESVASGRMAETARDFRSDPRQWLAEIERLRAAGQSAAAARELADLHAHYPDFAVPPAKGENPAKSP
jgi:hypothetical protein